VFFVASGLHSDGRARDQVMTREDLSFFKRWFSAHAASYRTGNSVDDKTIGLKVAHTRRVGREIVMIASALNLSDADLLLAETVALLHDVGRFKQYKDYGTFSDFASRNHAEIGLDVLSEHEVLLRCSPAETRLIRQVIHYHNRRVLPDEKDGKILFFARLLRDADKLDIWKVFVDYYAGRYEGVDSAVVWGLPDAPDCAPSILNALNASQMADAKHMGTVNDFKLLQISWVFDINFSPTFHAVFQRKYVDQIAAVLPQRPEISKAVGAARSYLQRRQHDPIEPCDSGERTWEAWAKR
jgi:putative nucleotidyltransferase with HDIG domain